MTKSNNNEWIEWNWTPEKRYPETLETLVYIKCLSDGYEEDYRYDPAEIGYWCDEGGVDIWEPNHFGSITHYRLA